MKVLSLDEANLFLSGIGKKIGNWNRIEDAVINQNSNGHWINYQMPSDAQELLNFATHVVSWLPKGKWKIFQIDDSNCLDSMQIILIQILLFGAGKLDRNLPRTFLFEFSEDKEINNKTELLIANLMHLFLLFEGHAYIVSEGGIAGQCVAVQDGFVYFSCRDKELDGAACLLKRFERNRLASPPWIMQMINDGLEGE
ncbi:hypothetical protein [Undibacterium umbellatum]|uniref:Uncharacterized protein n=1 Tax=Undibacterium umbellatum TaxID=2762300 RepID=A0ABR6Z8K8_9BURK|nr:hypothetical protein [Undibacterium umbellatum]MBC3907901.1 hypothetical protein [Undibacterium umbellatum]